MPMPLPVFVSGIIYICLSISSWSAVAILAAAAVVDTDIPTITPLPHSSFLSLPGFLPRFFPLTTEITWVIPEIML